VWVLKTQRRRGAEDAEGAAVARSGKVERSFKKKAVILNAAFGGFATKAE